MTPPLEAFFFTAHYVAHYVVKDRAPGPGSNRFRGSDFAVIYVKRFNNENNISQLCNVIQVKRVKFFFRKCNSWSFVIENMLYDVFNWHAWYFVHIIMHYMSH